MLPAAAILAIAAVAAAALLGVVDDPASNIPTVPTGHRTDTALSIILDVRLLSIWPGARPRYGLDRVVPELLNPVRSRPECAIVRGIRMPVAVMAIVVGKASPAQMQTILTDPLASPLTLGLSVLALARGPEEIDFGTLARAPVAR